MATLPGVAAASRDQIHCILSCPGCKSCSTALNQAVVQIGWGEPDWDSYPRFTPGAWLDEQPVCYVIRWPAQYATQAA
ncbi:hypothetical protein KCP76_01695 [Salmonella enterica subsp. enterica serovar Weltevreden]|nr:hypothetical protein KCP76_01695 [Salmonella enterica subsp. enterica serovar Weltevreden]